MRGDALRRLVTSSRLHLELLLDPRRDRRRLLRRAVFSFIVSIIALGLTAALLPGLVVPFPSA